MGPLSVDQRTWRVVLSACCTSTATLLFIRQIEFSNKEYGIYPIISKKLRGKLCRSFSTQPHGGYICGNMMAVVQRIVQHTEQHSAIHGIYGAPLTFVLSLSDNSGWMMFYLEYKGFLSVDENTIEDTYYFSYTGLLSVWDWFYQPIGMPNCLVPSPERIPFFPY